MTSAPAAISERVELAKHCASRDWSKAIRVLDSLLAHSCTIQDLCNRAFCYSQLELHKHVIKDCDKALQLDPTLIQAYILKGRAFSSLGRKYDALMVWEQGSEHAVRQSADLKQLLELEELLKFAKQERNPGCGSHVTESKSPMIIAESARHTNGKSHEFPKSQNKLSDISSSCRESGDASEICSKVGDNGQVIMGLRDNSLVTIPECGRRNGTSNGIYTNHNELGYISKPCSKMRETSKISSTSGDNFGIQLSEKTEEDTKADKNGICDVLDNMNCDSESSSVVNNTLELSSKPSSISTSSGDSSEIHIKLSNKSDMPNEACDETKKNKKFSVTRISKTKSITVDFRLSRGIAQVNEGKYTSAVAIFDQILREDPTYSEALIGRGTANAFQRELEAAIIDFSKAIQSNPLVGEAWKRRGQARAALGESVEAIQDLTKALEFEPNSADILHERGIVNFKFKDFDAAVEDLSACVKLDEDNKSAYTYLGLALSSIGEYKKAEEAHLKSIQLDRSFVEGLAHLTQFYQDLANSAKALECVQQVLQIDPRFAKAYHLHALLLHGMGEHRKAIKELSLGLSIENSNVECLYLRASCYHAIGEYGAAVKDYDAALDMELDSMEKFVLQCLAFYQKELALYTASKINGEFCWFNIDGDFDPLFKEYWCKRLHPKHVCEKVYRQPPLRDSLKRGKLKKQDFSMTKQKTALLMAADSIGKKIQYDCLGFLPNRRQHRMAGLAAIEIAQKVSKAWRSLQAEWKHSNKSLSKYGKRTRRRINMPSQNRGGAGCSTSSLLETSTSYGVTEEKLSGRHMMSWQDLYSLAVKWRQISEPCDPVVWVNKLSEEFNTGFGSHTPLILGQAKVVRYYPNFERTFNAAKMIMKDKLQVHNKANEIIELSKDEKLQNIMDAKTCSDLYKVIGEDFWLATWCNSSAIEGKRLEGTRITLVKMGEHGYDFAIKTPCTPSRWEEFDAEMTMAWEAVCNTYSGETFGSTDFDALENVRDAILRMTYYWYNFMPLSRGSAVVGFIVLLGLLLAANMEFEGEIPKGIQVDWEAILNFEPSSFVDSVKSWLYSSLKVTTSWKDYPDVASTFATTGSVVAALSSYND
ncbi:suppressor of RPS4-RLD 1 [Mercurialis annua]|uniref:suppressor of RPS4-RLD 1 n=1 Tax=Mercurialis annua TaxID=3986 RepID=UPI00215FA521|nr:suppressor of RPS4-RLD 1 [Mercurialis annua]